MSKLYASINSDARKTEATSRGHKHISSHTRGWDLGVRVVATLNHNGREVFEVYVTSGSSGGPSDDLIGRVALHDGYRYFFPVYKDDVRSREQARWLACAEGTGEIPFDPNG
jgi:hypothetical protein